jgi:hypothetical protein
MGTGGTPSLLSPRISSGIFSYANRGASAPALFTIAKRDDTFKAAQYEWMLLKETSRSLMLKLHFLQRRSKSLSHCRSSPRTISTGQLKTLLPLHTRPIYLIFYEGSYQIHSVGDLILRLASRLDAFSAYPSRTWVSSRASGDTTGTPAVRPSRSSRTRDRSSQISCARDR